ncbi:MAG: serine/threonine protein phosphatase [Ruminococcaceae bacterium]|nr:serine/threonine protein phosphatase [Oscillospiraceae bacterium]
MRYIASDIHGEYDLFMALLERIGFSNSDTLYVCGDMMDKGLQSMRLASYMCDKDNIRCILGNHEYAFLKYYRGIMERSPDDFDDVLLRLSTYFPGDGRRISWEIVDWLEELPSYIEEEDFICVHAGIPLDGEGYLQPLERVPLEQLLYGRGFKEPEVVHKSPKCVFFGHTSTDCVCGRNEILIYPRECVERTGTVRDFHKIHLDTGAWKSGVLGCFCVDTLETFYVKKEK